MDKSMRLSFFWPTLYNAFKQVGLHVGLCSVRCAETAAAICGPTGAIRSTHM